MTPPPDTMSVVRPAGSDTPRPGTTARSQAVLWMELRRSYTPTDGGHRVAVDVVRVIGEVDLSTAGQLATALAELVARPAARVVIDTTEMTFCGLRGLGALHDAARLATAHGAGLAIVGLSPQLARLSHELWPSPHPRVCADRTGAVAVLVAERAPLRLRPSALLEPR